MFKSGAGVTSSGQTLCVDLGNARYDNLEYLSNTHTDAAAAFKETFDELAFDTQLLNDLGLLFALGNGVAKDPRRAAKWYLRAAKQGHADAQVWVGHNFQYGQGAAVDPLEAARWYAMAQSNGSDTGKARLRLLLRDKPTARQVQQKLKDMGHYALRVDGSFGRGSYRALKKYCQCRF